MCGESGSDLDESGHYAGSAIATRPYSLSSFGVEEHVRHCVLYYFHTSQFRLHFHFRERPGKTRLGKSQRDVFLQPLRVLSATFFALVLCAICLVSGIPRYSFAAFV